MLAPVAKSSVRAPCQGLHRICRKNWITPTGANRLAKALARNYNLATLNLK